MENIKVLVTATPEGPKDKSVLKTPAGESNITVVTQSMWAQVAIRVLRTYLQGLVGFLVAGGVGLTAPLEIPGFYAMFLNAASLALAPAVISLLQNALEILTKLDSSNPQIRA